MLANKLKLNESKTELSLISSPRHVEIVSQLYMDLKIGGSVHTLSSSMKILGIAFDILLTIEQHVTALCRNINFHIRNLLCNLCTFREIFDTFQAGLWQLFARWFV